MARFFTKGFYDFISIYLTMSLITGIMTFWHDYQTFQLASDLYFIPLLCLAYTWWSFSNGPQILISYEQRPLIVFFLVQVIFYYGLGIATKEMGHLYLALAHAASAWLYFNFFCFSYPENKEKSFYLTLLVSTGLIWGTLSPFQFPKTESLTSIGSFLLLTIGSFIWVTGFSKHQFRQVFKGMMSKFKVAEDSNVQNNEQKDRLFFHDFINQTHGMTLYLNHKLSSESNLSRGELEGLVGEIRTLEKMFQAHFGLKHKDLNVGQEWYHFEKCKASFLKVIENFLPQDKYHKVISFTGDLSEQLASSKRSEIQVHFISLHRILTNLVKNVADHSPSRITIEFGHSQGLLKILFRNEMINKVVAGDLTRHLENAILQTEKERQHDSGLGLESIQELCEELSGTCQVYFEDGDWITQIELPTLVAGVLGAPIKQAA